MAVEHGTSLMGHCERCHQDVFALHDDIITNQGPVRFAHNIECLRCGYNGNSLFEDGVQCQKCKNKEEQEEISQRVDRAIASLMRLGARGAQNTQSSSQVQCIHCGGARSSRHRYCPHCRLDMAGRPADAGIRFLG